MTAVDKLSKPTADILKFLGAKDYYIRNIDCENCICRKIGNFEIELSNFKPKKMSLNLYVWELSNSGTPLQIVGRRFGISSKTELMNAIKYIESNIGISENIERFKKADLTINSLTTCETVQDNHGIIGTANAPVTINNK